MIKHILMTVLLAAAATAYPMQCLAAGQDWYPKATDSCATLVDHLIVTHDSEAWKSAAFWRDPAMSKLVSELNPGQLYLIIKGADQDESSAQYEFVWLLLLRYCDGHRIIKLGDVKPDEVMKEAMQMLNAQNADQAATPSSPQQTELAAQWSRWLTNSLDFCGANERCKEVARRAFANNAACTAGNRPACDERARDIADWNAQRNPQAQAPQAPPQETQMQCLQRVAQFTIKSCTAPNCDPRFLVDRVRLNQQAFCGYSAIEPNPAPAPNANPTNCMTNPDGIGGWITTCD